MLESFFNKVAGLKAYFEEHMPRLLVDVMAICNSETLLIFITHFVILSSFIAHPNKWTVTTLKGEIFAGKNVHVCHEVPSHPRN